MITWKCLLFRVPTITCIVALTGVYSLLFIDRFLELCAPKFYKKFEQNATGLIFLFLFIFIGSIIFYIFYEEEMFAWKSYCAANSQINHLKMIQAYGFLFIVDLLCSIMFVVMLRYSTHELQT